MGSPRIQQTHNIHSRHPLARDIGRAIIVNGENRTRCRGVRTARGGYVYFPRKATDMLQAWKATAREKGPGLSGFAMLGPWDRQGCGHPPLQFQKVLEGVLTSKAIWGLFHTQAGSQETLPCVYD